MLRSLTTFPGILHPNCKKLAFVNDFILPCRVQLQHNDIMLGIFRRFEKPQHKRVIQNLTERYEILIFNQSLNPDLLTSFQNRLSHARISGRDPERFLEEELKAFKILEMKVMKQEAIKALHQEAQQKTKAGESFADNVLNDFNQRIEHYPELNIHPDAEFEVQKLFGAMEYLDKHYWSVLEVFFRRAFSRPGQIDRVSIEQQFWRFSSSRRDRLPEVLENYRRSLISPSASSRQKSREAQLVIKSVAFFLNDLMDVCQRAAQIVEVEQDVEQAIAYVHNILEDFRIKHFRQRRL